MRRRANKSSKVPNVKLRPALPQASTSPRTRTESFQYGVCLAQDSQLGSDDTSIMDFCSRPFKGVVVCATGVADKPSLFKQALELGATSVLAFTDRVTHLVAAAHGGAKYTCAVERKIPILLPSWITESYQIWLRGDDVDFEEMTRKHRLPIFSGIILSPSGITCVTQRTQINKLLTENGGAYVKNLERPVKVTHLLCSGEEETDKMRYAEKFNRTGEAKIKLVWEEWFWDSLEFGGRFDEDKYQVHRPRPERKSVPEPPPPSQTQTLSSSLPQGESVESEAPESAKKKEKPADGEDDEEAASVKVLPAVTLHLWESLLKVRGFGLNEYGTLQRSPVKAKKPQADETHAAGLFTGYNFCALGDARTDSVREAIQGNGGIWLGDADRTQRTTDYIIVRLVSGSRIFHQEKSASQRGKYRTECWLERCIFEERIVEPEENIAFVPLAVQKLPLDGADGITLSFSGLDQSEACFIKRLARALGITIGSAFSRKSTHLLCPSGQGAKFDKAKEWGIPVVGMGWLEEIVSTGKIGPIDRWLVGAGGEINENIVEQVEQQDLPVKKVDKGKGKAKDPLMANITNNIQLEDRQTDEVMQPPPGGSPRSMFGTPNSLLGFPLPEEPVFNSVQIPPEHGQSAEPLMSSSGPSSIPLEHMTRPNTPVAVSRSPTKSQLWQDKRNGRVPSSTTPSPMKLVARRTPSPVKGMPRKGPISPTKIPEEAARALQESITSLLGKRREGDETEVAKSKRARPLRSKPQSRQTSHAVIGDDALQSTYSSSSAEGSGSLDDGLNLIGPEGEGKSEESMCIMYADPGQEEEKRRLMTLLGSDSQEGRIATRGRAKGGVDKKIMRRSARIAGF